MKTIWIGGFILMLGTLATPAFAADNPFVWAAQYPSFSSVQGVLARVSGRAKAANPEVEMALFDGRLYGVVDGIYYDDDGKAWQPLVVTTTAYVPCKAQCDDDPGITATGSDAFANYGIAADPTAIPYGTIVRVPEYGDAKIDDTGGAMRQDWKKGVIHLDLRIPLRRHDGAWRSEGACNKIALEHGVQKNRIVLRNIASLDAVEVVASAK